MTKAFWQLILLHFREFFREPEVLFWTILFPMLLAGVLGVAFLNKGAVPQTIGVLEAAVPQPGLEDLADRLRAPGVEALLKQLDMPNIKTKLFTEKRQALIALKRGDIPLYVSWDQKTDQPRFHFDPQNNTAKLLYLMLDKKLNPASDHNVVAPLVTPGLRYIDFLIPGLIAMGIMQSCLWAIGWGLIDRRIKKMLRRMVATPLNRYVFLLSYFLTRIVISFFEIMMLVLFAHLVFHVQLQGSWPAFLLLFLCGNFAFAGIAILMACRAKNNQVGNGLINAISIPMMVLSGIFFSYRNFPHWAVVLIEKLPLTLLADSMRKVFIEGAGLLQITAPALGLVAFGLVTLVLGQRFFKWY